MSTIYHAESTRGTSKYTFTVCELFDGSYRAISCVYRSRKNGAEEVTFKKEWLLSTKEELKHNDFKRFRLAKEFLTSDFWSQQDEI
ncbi:Uncharacterised protein [Yersinia aldovae]|uniref:hypothetical protein n=1 Tax=Yersinia aldovae TaxID=29483 RepID=UPI0005E11EAC|nr:hypothetical protein [Yersinia aldovae]CNK26087.1 Uncharacterised protein [Yersinia aldovae]